MLTPERAQFTTDEINAWEQDHDKKGLVCEELWALVEDDDASLFQGFDILKQFMEDTEITLEELEEWHEQTKSPDELDIHPDHRK